MTMTRNKTHANRLLSGASLLAILQLLAPSALGLPQGPTVINGIHTTTISTPTFSKMEIENAPGAIIDWDSFSIAGGEWVEFVQQDAASAILNRVTGADISQISGQLTSNGRVFLINPNGLVIGNGARIDTRHFIGSTLELDNQDFLDGDYSFSAGSVHGDIVVENNAVISTNATSEGGQVWLIAKSVDLQAGSMIESEYGQVGIAAGADVQVFDSAAGYMTFTVEAPAGSTLEAMGEIAARRGAIGLFADQITIGGTVATQSSANVRGQINVHAEGDITVLDGGVVDVSGFGETDGGVIEMEAGGRLLIEPLAEVTADGGHNATSPGDGGEISLIANQIAVAQTANGRGNLHAMAGGGGGAIGTILMSETGTPTGVDIDLLGTANVTVDAPCNSNAVGWCYGKNVGKFIVLADGNIVVSTWGWRNFEYIEPGWTSPALYSETYVFLRVFSPDGTLVAGPVSVRADDHLGSDFRMVALKGGGFAVVHRGLQDYPNGNTQTTDALWYQVFDKNGSSLTAPAQIVDAGRPQSLSVIELSTGGFLVQYMVGADNNTYIKAYDANGALLGSSSILGSGTLRPLADGTAMLELWENSFPLPYIVSSSGQIVSSIAPSATNVGTVVAGLDHTVSLFGYSPQEIARYSIDGTLLSSTTATSAPRLVLSNGMLVDRLYGATIKGFRSGSLTEVSMQGDTSNSVSHSVYGNLPDGRFLALQAQSNAPTGNWQISFNSVGLAYNASTTTGTVTGALQDVPNQSTNTSQQNGTWDSATSGPTTNPPPSPPPNNQPSSSPLTPQVDDTVQKLEALDRCLVHQDLSCANRIINAGGVNLQTSTLSNMTWEERRELIRELILRKRHGYDAGGVMLALSPEELADMRKALLMRIRDLKDARNQFAASMTSSMGDLDAEFAWVQTVNQAVSAVEVTLKAKDALKKSIAIMENVGQTTLGIGKFIFTSEAKTMQGKAVAIDALNTASSSFNSNFHNAVKAAANSSADVGYQDGEAAMIWAVTSSSATALLNYASPQFWGNALVSGLATIGMTVTGDIDPQTGYQMVMASAQSTSATTFQYQQAVNAYNEAKANLISVRTSGIASLDAKIAETEELLRLLGMPGGS